MDSNYFRYLEGEFIACCLWIVAITALATAGVILGAPVLWHWIKPIIHSITG